MTEREALDAAREHVLDAQAALEVFRGVSSAADKAHWQLCAVLDTLDGGLECLANARTGQAGAQRPRRGMGRVE